MNHIKLSEWARRHSYTYRGAWGLYKRGGIPNSKELASGAIVVEEEEAPGMPEYSSNVYRKSSTTVGFGMEGGL
jgi:hypothetical protein